MSTFVKAYAKSTGRIQHVPAHFIGHPVLGKNLELAPSARDQLAEPAPPSLSWTRGELDEHAAGLGIDSTDLATKADVLAAIEDAPTETTDDTGSSANTPA